MYMMYFGFGSFIPGRYLALSGLICHYSIFYYSILWAPSGLRVRCVSVVARRVLGHVRLVWGVGLLVFLLRRPVLVGFLTLRF